MDFSHVRRHFDASIPPPPTHTPSQSALSSSNVVLSSAACESLGRLCQVVGEPAFVSDLIHEVYTRLRSSVRNPIARAAHCLAVGCLHRCVGALASGQHLATSIGVLLPIAQDPLLPETQMWALHSLAMLADSGGPMFREYVDPSLGLVLQLLLRSPTAMHEIQRSLGRLLGALISTLGPELRGWLRQLGVHFLTRCLSQFIHNSNLLYRCDQYA